MTNTLVDTSSHRRVTEEDLVPGQQIVRASVGKYLGPGFDPRVSIKETVLILDDQEESPICDGYVYYRTEKGTEALISLEEILRGKENSDGGSITYWVAQSC